MAKKTALAVILAAGEGTRMRSSRPKVMHEVGRLPMLGHVLAVAAAAGITRRAVVVGAGAEPVRAFVRAAGADVAVHTQRRRLGTAHAVLCARDSLTPTADHVIILYGDTPLVTPDALRRLRRRLSAGADVVVFGFRPPDPKGYGRLITAGRRLLAIREEVEASEEEKEIGLCNGGIMGFSGPGALAILKRIGNRNAKGEYFLTNAVEIANALGKRAVAMEVPAEEIHGVDSRHDLAAAEAIFQARARSRAMAAGVTLIAPETVWFSHDTKIERDAIVEPNVVFGPGVKIGEGVRILASSHIEGAIIGAGATIGPFARLRPGVVIGAGARIGNFVEIKKAEIGAGAKVSHLSYIGDAIIGAGVNFGAGAITCNYDGFAKYTTEIGAGAFIGSNVALIAPVSVGDRAFISTGTVVTKNVGADALAVGRSRQTNKPGWARKFRAKHDSAHGNRNERKPR